jgi:pimeloyl-ACP methyl ester carboxylesterase
MHPACATSIEVIAACAPPRAVAMVVHGLNTDPCRMAAIIDQLVQWGIEVLSISLFGHGPNFVHQSGVTEAAARMSSFQRVTASLWHAEMRAAYAVAALRAAQLGDAPLFFVGFSLGGLMGCHLLAATPYAHFDKLVLFAPALAIRTYSQLLRWLAPCPRLIFPSFAPPAYRANRGTPIAAYNAVFATLAELHTRPGDGLQIPALVFLDRDDELVSYTGVKRFIQARSLAQWRLHTVRKQPECARQYHHLLIDAAAVGGSVWEEMMELMQQHL